MPRRKGTKKKFTEDDERKQKLEAMLKQFDMEVDRRVYEMQRATEHACVNIDGMFKLERLKIPLAQRQELWESSQHTAAVERTLSAVDAVLSEAERTVQQKPAGRGRGRPARTRATPASSSSSCSLVTPLQPPRPLHSSTPAVTPKFDPMTVHRQPPSTMRRRRPREVLMSLQGSPVVADDAAQTGTGTAAVAEPKQHLQQTVELLRQEVELDDETRQLMATLRDQLDDLTTAADADI